VAILILSVFTTLCVPISFAKTEIKMKSKLTIPVDRSYTLKISGTNKTPKWTTADKSIATVSKSGKVTAKSLGNTKITATVGSTTLSCKVTVKTLLIGHRGYSSEYPENTKEAFVGAFENGFDGIECDVWESTNHDLMVSHDPTLDRTTGKSGYIWNVNTTNRSEYPIINSNGIENYKNKNVLIPTLQETAKIVAKYNGYLMLHIKSRDYLGNKLSTTGANKIVKVLKKYGISGKTIIFTSGKKNINKFRKSGIKRGVFIDPETKNDFEPTLKWCKKNNIKTMIYCSLNVVQRYGDNEKLFALARKYNMPVGIYKASSSKQYTVLTDLGATFVMSNYHLSYNE
jgi:glycerophosphoryl diester phosphodiesterase